MENTIILLLCFFLLLNSTMSFQLKKGYQKLQNIQAAHYNEAYSKDYAYISMITHCTDSQILKWDCKLCKNITLTENVMIQNATYSISGFLGYSKKYDQIIISWRGTVDAKNWQQDVKFFKTKYTPKSGTCSNCQVHLGVYESYKSVQQQIIKQIGQILIKHPNATITSTGHSLGGGLSLLTNLQLAQLYPHRMASSAYNFGCLRIGNSQFVQFMRTKLPVIHRVVHNRDPVPHVPPADFQYMHPAYQILYDQNMSTHVVCNQSGQDKNCSNKYVPLLVPSDHTFYFVPTDASVC